MRDIALSLIVFGSIPFILRRPYIGVLMWTWLGVMSPHRLTFGFAYDMPFAQIIGFVTLVAIVFSREPKRLPINAVTVLLILFNIWMLVTTFFALSPETAWPQWQKVFKIQIMIFLMLFLFYTKLHIQAAAWVITLSLAFFGVKGGIYTILGGGEGMVLGPPGSFIEGNTTIALAIIMIMPLMYYLRNLSDKWWIRHGMLAGMILSAFAFVGSHSRGGLLAGAAMGGFLWLKSKNKGLVGMVLLLIIPAILAMMPEKWFDKMETIQTYQEDTSAMGRINAWWMAYNLAKAHPITGGGFEIWDLRFFLQYAPDPLDVHAAHSIYFSVLGEHGFVGLALYLALWLATWVTLSQTVRAAAGQPKVEWAADLARMIQVSLVGYAVGGAFLSLSYFDLPYYLMAVAVLIRRFVQDEAAETKRAAHTPVPLQSSTAAAGKATSGTRPMQSLNS